jgi:hypothetical protein
MIFLKHVAEFLCDALRHDNRSSGADSDDLHMFNGAKAADDVFESIVTHKEGISARKQDVANGRCVANILNTSVYLLFLYGSVMLSGKAATCTVSAVHGTLVGDEEQNTVRITMSQSGNRRVFVFTQRIEEIG